MNSKKSKFESVSTYQQYLPALLQEDVFVGQFLLAFEKILSGLDETPSKEQIITAKTQNPPGLEEIIDNIHLYFNPEKTPEEFLPWLAGWVALSLRNDWKVEVKRAFILQIVGLYRLRGTKAGLEKILGIYLENSGFEKKVKVFDQFANFPNYFQVQLTLNTPDFDKYWREAKIAKAIIDRDKPAQTFYTLKILVPTMRLTKRSQVAYPFKLFEPIQNKTFIEKIELEAIVEVTQPNPVTTDVLNKITVRLQDDVSDFHLFTPETIIENQKIIIKRTLYYKQFIQTRDKFKVTIKNLNNIDIAGKVTVQVSLNINQRLSTHKLLEENFTIEKVLPKNILQMCRIVGETHTEDETILTILGTTTQSFNKTESENNG